MLPMTPGPEKNESLVGYLIRVAEINGYDSPGTVACYAGYRSGAQVLAKCDLQPLATALNRDASELRRISYAEEAEGSPGHIQFAGHVISTWRVARILSPKATTVCPKCIAEKGYLESFWDLTLAVACPKHRCEAVSVCPACQSPVSWLRSGLLTCRCGASLSSSKGVRVDESEAELVELLRLKLYRRRLTLCANRSEFPVAEFKAMSFHQLASVLFILGQHMSGVTHEEAMKDPQAVVATAARALRQWPRGFHKALRRLGAERGVNTDQLDQLRQLYGGFFRAITTERSLAAEASFLRAEFEAFLVKHECGRYLEVKRLDRQKAIRLRPSMNVSWICDRFDVQPKRLEGWCKAAHKSNAAISPMDLKRFVVQAELMNHLGRARQSTIGARRAAALVGVPVSVLKGLRGLGYLEPSSRVNRQGAYLLSDIDGLANALRAIGGRVSENSVDMDTHVSLARLLETATFWSAGGKAEFLLRVLDGRLKAVGRTGDTLHQLYFSKAEVGEYIGATKEAQSKGGVTRNKAAEMLGCPSGYIDHLADLGYIKRVTGPYYRRIDVSSVRKFGREYCSLTALANQTGTSTRSLMRMAKGAELQILSVKTGSAVESGFVPRSEVRTLKAIIRVRDNPPETPSAPTVVERLSQYFESLRRTSTALPRVGTKPNLRAIANASGVNRCLFYQNQEARELLGEAERHDARRYGIDSRPELEILAAYLKELKARGKSLPTYGGIPNKRLIAQEAGVDRNLCKRFIWGVLPLVA
ncbi:MAG: TniQ family protein [Pseudomonadota bacterium]